MTNPVIVPPDATLRQGQTALSTPTIDVAFVLRGAWFGLVALGVVGLVSWADWNALWAGRDLERYMAGATGLWTSLDPYTGTGYLYSPAYALLVSPLTILPFPVTLALWRIAEVAVLIVAVRGTVLGWGVFLFPWFWGSELVGANMMGFAAAAMIAVIRWPSVRSVALYALMVALVPKPAFLPVLAYGFVVVPEARRWVVLIGAFGLVQLLWPGYLHAMLSGNEGYMANWRWPWWVTVTGVGVAAVGIWWPRLLGVAAVMVTPYVFVYQLMPLATLLVRRQR